MKTKKFYPWLVVALLWVVALLNYMDRQMLSTMQGAMKLDIVELQKAEAFGALMAVFLWIYGIVSPFAGVVADRVSRKKLVVGSLFVWSGSNLSHGLRYRLHAALLSACADGCERGAVHTLGSVAHRRLA